MVVRYNWFWLDSCSCQKVHECSFEFSLTCFKVVSSVNSSFYFMHSWQKCILGWSINESTPLFHWSNCKNSWWWDFCFTSLNRLHYWLVGAVKIFLDFGESLSIGSPKNNNLIQIIIFLEVSNIFLDDFQMLFLAGSLNNIICSLCLVCCNKIWVINWFHWFESLHIWS